MDKASEVLGRFVESGNWFGLAVLLAILVTALALNNLRALVDTMRTFRREHYIVEALKNEAISGSARTLLQEELMFLQIKRGTGLVANRATRDKIQELIEKSKGELSTHGLAEMQHRLLYENGRLAAHEKRYDGTVLWFVRLVAGVILLGGVVLMPWALIGVTTDWRAAVLLFGAGAVYVLLAVLLAMQVQHISAARRLGPILERLQPGD